MAYHVSPLTINERSNKTITQKEWKQDPENGLYAQQCCTIRTGNVVQQNEPYERAKNSE